MLLWLSVCTGKGDFKEIEEERIPNMTDELSVANLNLFDLNELITSQKVDFLEMKHNIR
jgi:hypothetical protein